jgi:nitrogen fixation/metabolism regulation signal transduction histidine kinase
MPDDGRRERMASGPHYGAGDPPGDGATDGGSAMDEPGDPVADRDGITVTVGRTDDGFYVADDGLGIPHEDRERVFDYGFTTHEGGSGFGLAVVETIADAHGWDVAVTESVVGGARFEVTGVDRFGRGRDPERPE